MNPVKLDVLIASANSELVNLLDYLLSKEKHRCAKVSRSDGVLENLNQGHFGLAVLDLDMPGREAFTAYRAIHCCPFLRQTPLLLVSRHVHAFDDHMLERGSIYETYLLSPFEPEDLYIRMKAVLNRAAANLDINQITKLPGNSFFIRELSDRIDAKGLFVMLRGDIKHFGSYNERYGYSRGDDVLRVASRIMMETVSNFGNNDDFIGHFGGDNFVILTSVDKAETISQKTVQRFDETIPGFYDSEDRKNKFILLCNRKGQYTAHPLMSLVVIGTSNASREISHAGQLNAIWKELSGYSDRVERNVLILDRRSG